MINGAAVSVCISCYRRERLETLGTVIAAWLKEPIEELLLVLCGEGAAEDRVTRIRSRGGQNGAIEIGLDLEVLLEDRLQRTPLVEAHTVDHDEHGGFLVSEQGQEELRDDIHRQRGSVVPIFCDPARVVRSHELGELAARVGDRDHVKPGIAITARSIL